MERPEKIRWTTTSPPGSAIEVRSAQIPPDIQARIARALDGEDYGPGVIRFLARDWLFWLYVVTGFGLGVFTLVCWLRGV